MASTRGENCGLSPHSRVAKMGQGVTHAGLARSARQGSALPDWHAFCFLESTSSGPEALRGVVVPGLTSIRQGPLGPTPRICSARGSGFGSGLSECEYSETSRRLLGSRDDLLALREQRAGIGFKSRSRMVGVDGRVRPEWTSPALAATRCRLCRSRARPGGTGSCDRYRGFLQREPCYRP